MVIHFTLKYGLKHVSRIADMLTIMMTNLELNEFSIIAFILPILLILPFASYVVMKDKAEWKRIDKKIKEATHRNK